MTEPTIKQYPLEGKLLHGYTNGTHVFVAYQELVSQFALHHVPPATLQRKKRSVVREERHCPTPHLRQLKTVRAVSEKTKKASVVTLTEAQDLLVALAGRRIKRVQTSADGVRLQAESDRMDMDTDDTRTQEQPAPAHSERTDVRNQEQQLPSERETGDARSEEHRIPLQSDAREECSGFACEDELDDDSPPAPIAPERQSADKDLDPQLPLQSGECPGTGSAREDDPIAPAERQSAGEGVDPQLTLEADASGEYPGSALGDDDRLPAPQGGDEHRIRPEARPSTSRIKTLSSMDGNLELRGALEAMYTFYTEEHNHRRSGQKLCEVTAKKSVQRVQSTSSSHTHTHSLPLTLLISYTLYISVAVFLAYVQHSGSTPALTHMAELELLEGFFTHRKVTAFI
jgi:hypothetical protein